MTATILRPELEAHIEALAARLQSEFGVPFLILDAETNAPVFGEDRAAEIYGIESPAPVGHAHRGQVAVRSLFDGGYQLELPLYRGRKVVYVAVGHVTPLLRGIGGPEAVREREMLESWLHAVSEQLRLREQLHIRKAAEEELSEQTTSAWDTLLTVDEIVRHLRVYKEPERLQRVLEAALRLLKAEGIFWVPKALDVPAVSRGALLLSQSDAESLMAVVLEEADLSARAPYICNDVPQTLWGGRFRGVQNLLALQATDHGPLGWLLAVNKHEGRGFRKADAAILSPFLSIIESYGKNQARFQDLKGLLVGLTRSLTTAIEAKDSYTLGHSECVARIAVEIARHLGMRGSELGDVYLAGLLHDIGKIGIQDHILQKPGGLTPEEHDQVKEHVSIGYAILSELRAVHNLLPGVLYHHEKFDGTGYPDGLKGESIPLLARIIAVADAYDSMSTARPYRDALPCLEVEERLKEGAGGYWDPEVVQALLRARHEIHAIRQCGVGESLRIALDNALGHRRNPGDSTWVVSVLPTE